MNSIGDKLHMYNYVMYHRLIIFYNDAFACSRTMKVYRCFFYLKMYCFSLSGLDMKWKADLCSRDKEE